MLTKKQTYRAVAAYWAMLVPLLISLFHINHDGLWAAALSVLMVGVIAGAAGSSQVIGRYDGFYATEKSTKLFQASHEERHRALLIWQEEAGDKHALAEITQECDRWCTHYRNDKVALELEEANGWQLPFNILSVAQQEVLEELNKPKPKEPPKLSRGHGVNDGFSPYCDCGDCQWILYRKDLNRSKYSTYNYNKY